jgi:hypothetical protein
VLFSDAATIPASSANWIYVTGVFIAIRGEHTTASIQDFLKSFGAGGKAKELGA